MSTGRTTAPFLYVTEVDISIDNGPGINEREFVRALRAEYADEVICVLPYPSRPDVHHDPGIEYVFSPRRRAHRYPAYLVSAFRRIRRLKRRHGIAAVAFRMGITPVLPLAVSRGLGVPIILKTLLLYAIFGEDERFKGSRTTVANIVSRVGQVLKPGYRSVVRRCILADTANEAYAEWLRERFELSGDRLLVIPNGFNPDVFSAGDAGAAKRALGLDEFDYIMGYVGRFSGIRHVDRLIHCVAALADSVNVGLVLVGDGPDRNALETLARSCGVEDRVRFVGTIPYSEVPHYMQSFDVALDLTLVTVKVRDGERHASFSQKIAQYLGAGIPVVALDTPDTRFLKDEQIGAVVPIDEPAALVGAVEALLRGMPEERDALRDRVRQYAAARLTAGRVTALRVDAWRRAVGSGATRRAVAAAARSAATTEEVLHGVL